MILTSLTRAMREQNYYAVVLEFLIVVAGVVIGFQITAWSESRTERANAQIYSLGLLQDLEVEAQLLAQTIAYFENVSAYSREAERLIADAGAGSDEQLLVALYNATQYIRPNRIDPTYQAMISQGVGALIESRLASLTIRHYSSNNTNLLADFVLNSAFRNRLRRAMPSSIQSVIRNQCGDIRDENGFVFALSQNCDVEFGDLDVSGAAAQFRTDDELRSDLALLVSTLDAYIADNVADLTLLQNELSVLRSG
jgi:hypothetical protein